MNETERTQNVQIEPQTPGEVTTPGEPSDSVLMRMLRHRVPGCEIHEEIGRGGMGVVYRATQTSLDREIAVKFLKESYAPDSRTARRFLDEARITAGLPHPGIPAVHDFGMLPDGRPFLVMKLIRGRTLEQLLRDEGPSPTRWLGVFEGLCQAVGFAHSRGVIHRDLKPGNVMVGAFGEVQVMDWGLAKQLGAAELPESGGDSASGDARASQAQTNTLAGSLIGTPAFMPPEQAAGDLARVDARSDVFGLGAVLCAMLTGQPPYTAGTVEAIKAMALAGDQAALQARLEGSGADAGLIDLCRRCLSPEPGQRPATGSVVAGEVAALRRAADERARDAERRQALAEVQAEEQRKRRRLTLAAAAAVSAVLLGGAVVGFWQAKRARIAESNAIEEAANARAAEKATAEQERATAAALATAEKTAAFLQRVFAMPAQAATAEVRRSFTVFEAMDRGIAELDRWFGGRPQEEAAIRLTLGQTLAQLGETARAREQLAKSLAINETLHGPDAEPTCVVLNELALLHQRDGDFAKAESMLRYVLAATQQRHGDDDFRTLSVKTNLGLLYDAMGEAAKAELHLREARDAAAVHLDRGHEVALACALNYALFQQRRGNAAAAEEDLRNVLDERRKTLGPHHPDTIVCFNNLADLLESAGRHGEAEAMFREALALADTGLEANHPHRWLLEHNLAGNLAAQGRSEEAEALYRSALAGRERDLPPRHPDRFATMAELARVLADRAEHDKAAGLFAPAIAGLEDTLGKSHRQTLHAAANFAMLLVKLDRLDEADAILRDAMPRFRETFGDRSPDAFEVMRSLGDLCLKRRNAAEGRQLHQDAEAGLRRLARSDEALSEHLSRAGMIFYQRGLFEDAEDAFADCLELRNRRWPEHWSAHSMTMLHGLALLAMDRVDEGEAAIDSGYRKLVTSEFTNPSQKSKVQAELIKLVEARYRQRGEAEKADAWAAKLK